MRVLLGLVTTVIAVVLMPTSVHAGWSLDVESGVVFNGYNDVRIPGNSGTDLSLTDDLESEETGFVRARLAVDLGSRHRLSLLVAPLRIEASGRLGRDVYYNGVQFTSGETVNSRYRFDSYRLSWSYRLAQSDEVTFDLGLTAKIRDAAIRLVGEDSSSEKTNTGFVPLINFALDWNWGDQFGMLVEGDALAAPQGRAEDVLAAVYADVLDNLRLRLGYRILEGGADNDEVYNFTAVHYLSAGLTLTM